MRARTAPEAAFRTHWAAASVTLRTPHRAPPMLRSLILTPALVLALASGCSSSQPAPGSASQETQTATTGEPFVLAQGNAVQVAGHSLRFVDVVEDSRCPTGVTCVWGGRAKVRLSASDPDGNEASQVLTLAYDGMTTDESPEWTVGGVVVELLALNPYPGSGSAQGAAREIEVSVTPIR